MLLYSISFLNFVTQLRFGPDPLPLMLRNSRQPMTLALLPRDDRVERTVDPRCISKTNNQPCYAVYLLRTNPLAPSLF